MRKFLVIECLTGGSSKDCTLLRLCAIILDDQLTPLQTLDIDVAPPTSQRYIVDANHLLSHGIDLASHSAKAEPLPMVSQKLFRMLYNHTMFGREQLTLIGFRTEEITEIVGRILKHKNWDLFVRRPYIDLSSICAHKQMKGELPTDLTIDIPHLSSHLNIEVVDKSLLATVDAIIEIVKKI